MLAMQQRPKRLRSPTPPPEEDFDLDISSPLDIMAKRRRRETERYHFGSENGGDQAESSTAWMRPAVNGRRSRQWQHLNAPSSSTLGSSENGELPASQATQASPSPNPMSPSQHHQHPPSPPSLPSSHPPRMREPGLLSSSPVRHEPPGSSPFRSTGHHQDYNKGVRTYLNGVANGTSEYGIGGGQAKNNMEKSVGSGAEADEMDWNEEDLGREWGEYAANNSVLYSLHKSRNTNNHHSGTFHHPTPVRLNVPESSSPHAPSPSIRNTGLHASNSHNHMPPPAYTTYQSLQYTPQHQSTYRNALPPSSSTQFPSSSPFGMPPNSEATQYDKGDEEGMEMLSEELQGSPSVGSAAEVRRRYEEANRLLGELAVARMQRWGET